MKTTFYPYMGALIWISLLLLIGSLLRAKIAFLQKGLVPSALIGGIVGFILINNGVIGMPTTEGWKEIPTSSFGVIVFHVFAYGFVGVGLMSHGDSKQEEAPKGSWLRSGALWMALIYCLVYALQGLSGKTIFQLFSYISSTPIFSGLGYLVSTGFSQNPGAAQTIGLIWENEFGIQGASSVGLAFGAIGFLCAAIIGIPLAYRGVKKGWITEKNLGEMPRSLFRGIMEPHEIGPCANATTHSGNIDSFAFHLAIMFALYGIGYVFALGWELVNWPSSIVQIRSLGFGLLYVWAMLAGMIFRKILKKMGKLYILDNATVRRVTGTTVDFMICAVFMGIAVRDIRNIFIPFFVTVIISALLTFVVIFWFSHRMSQYGFERGLAIFGCYTGTVASGLLLLRIVDPEFKSPAAAELAVMNVFILPIVQIIYINLPFVPSPRSIMIPVLIGYLVLMPLALFLLRFVKKRVW